MNFEALNHSSFNNIWQLSKTHMLLADPISSMMLLWEGGVQKLLANTTFECWSCIKFVPKRQHHNQKVLYIVLEENKRNQLHGLPSLGSKTFELHMVKLLGFVLCFCTSSCVKWKIKQYPCMWRIYQVRVCIQGHPNYLSGEDFRQNWI